jgi:DNA-binding winged helix-turn-helix (wHTH) protein
MNIVLNTENIDIINEFIRICKDKGDVVINAKVGDTLFETIANGGADAYVVTDSSYSQKAIDFIKKSSQYVPVILVSDYWADEKSTVKADVVMSYNKEMHVGFFCTSVRYNIATYVKNFATLKKLTTKMADAVEFGNCKYDPTRMILYVNNKEIKKFSKKEGALLEILAMNFGQIVKKDVILQRIWGQSDYFVSRSLDVYTTHLRKSLKAAKIKMCVKNISNAGLILEVLTEPTT